MPASSAAGHFELPGAVTVDETDTAMEAFPTSAKLPTVHPGPDEHPGHANSGGGAPPRSRDNSPRRRGSFRGNAESFQGATAITGSELRDYQKHQRHSVVVADESHQRGRSGGVLRRNSLRQQSASASATSHDDAPHPRHSVLSDVLHSVSHGVHDLGVAIGNSKVQLLNEDNQPGKVATTELYFDLIFVAAMFRLGTMVAYNLTNNGNQEYAYDSAVLFLVLWLTWHHVNMLFTRFVLEPPWNLVVVLIMVLTLVLAISLVAYEKVAVHKGASPNSTASSYNATSTATKTYVYKISSGLGTRLFQSVWAISRLLFLAMYFTGGLYNQRARKMTKVYEAFLAGVVLLLLIGVCVNEREAYVGISTVVVLLEMGMYGGALYYTPTESRLPIDVAHNIERAELWTILVIGETMLSLVYGAEEKYAPDDFTYWTNTILAFMINYTLMQFYERSQPEEEDEEEDHLDSHAVDVSLFRSVLFDASQAVVTLGLFAFGVGVKFVVKYGHHKDGSMYDQDYSWLFSFGTGVSLLAMTLSRYLHEWANFYVVRTNIPRKRMWLVPLAMAILILCLPLFTVETDCAGGECKRTGLSATAYLLCISACLFVATVCDVVSHITPNEVKELLEEFRGMTTDLRAGVIPDDIDDSLIDVDKLTVIGTTLVGVTKFRKPGSRAVRFSDRFMADVARERMGAKKQRVLKKAHVVASFASMFTQYQGAVDENEPAHPLGTTNLAKDRWKSSTRSIGIQQRVVQTLQENTVADVPKAPSPEHKDSLRVEEHFSPGEGAKDASAHSGGSREGEGASAVDAQPTQPRGNKVAPADIAVPV